MKYMKRIFALCMALLLVCSFAAAEEAMTDYNVKQFSYKLWSDWSLVEKDETTHYHYKDNQQNADAGFILVQIQSLDASSLDLTVPVMQELVLNMLVGKLADSLETEFTGQMATYGSVTGWAFQGPWPSQNCNIAGFVCNDGGDILFVMYADDHTDIDTLFAKLTEEIIPTIAIGK